MNTSLESYAKRLLPKDSYEKFIDSRKGKEDYGDHFIQAPMGPLREAQIHARSLLKPGRASLKRPPPEVTPSVQKPKKQKVDSNPLGSLVKAIATSESLGSPSRIIQQSDTLPASVPTSTPSPLKNLFTIESCRELVVSGYRKKGTNFKFGVGLLQNFGIAIQLLRVVHKNYEAILVSDSNEPKQWLYPCSSKVDDCEGVGYQLLSKKLNSGSNPLCPCCHIKERNKKQSERRQQHRSSDRLPRYTSLTQEQRQEQAKLLKLQLRRKDQAIKRLKQRLQKTSPEITIKNMNEAVERMQQAFKFIEKNEKDATKIIIDALLELKTNNSIQMDKQEEMEQYADFLVSEIKNTCHSWTGNKNQIRFHPIIANIAMNLYCG